ncbi:hypothetical protein RRG08_021135 [Elysia crispata]|uniref:Uncharacterized protein n=1 Tax=Elysia crispata TaxID=231223 RepID=A0AAE0Z5R2_9GAST|nr:hypothetical protein RRG08_021135 [Elysia crispata]
MLVLTCTPERFDSVSRNIGAIYRQLVSTLWMIEAAWLCEAVFYQFKITHSSSAREHVDLARPGTRETHNIQHITVLYRYCRAAGSCSHSISSITYL